MLCPIDGETLLMTSREGIEIDYCPRCRGVWLDRGELDKIIERSATSSTQQSEFRTRPQKDDDDDDDRKERKSSRIDPKRSSKDGKPEHYRKSRKHASFIKELFDF